MSVVAVVCLGLLVVACVIVIAVRDLAPTADANNNAQISAIDLIEIRKLIKEVSVNISDSDLSLGHTGETARRNPRRK